MQIKLWGVRGSLPTPMQEGEIRRKFLNILEKEQEQLKNPGKKIDALIKELPEYLSRVVGGETTCVEVLSDGVQLILDVGSGARRLGYDMLSRAEKHDSNVLLTHTHWDHMQGWPFFPPAQDPERTIHFYSCIENLEERFIHQQKPEFADEEFLASPAVKQFHYIRPGGAFDIGPFHITTQQLLHPGGSVSYKIESKGKTFIFATDTEFYGPELSELILQYNDFFHAADLMIMDAQYSLAEAEQKKGWGHTAMTIAVDCCIHWNIKQLILTHHEPAHEDDKIYELYDKAENYLQQSNPRHQELKIFLARQDDVYRL